MIRHKNLLLLFFALIFALICAEVVVSTAGRLKYKAEHNLNNIPEYKYSFSDINPRLSDYHCNSLSYCANKMRLPSGTGYRKTPIVIFGSSYAHGGRNLLQTQTLSHKISTYTRRPVYNMAVQNQGLSFMLWLSENDDFYNEIPEADTYIYVFREDDFRKMLSYKYSPTDSQFLLKYSYNGDDKYLNREKHISPIFNFIKSTYLASFYDSYKIKTYLNDKQNSELITDIAVQYLVQTRANIEHHFNKKVKFIVIIYSKPNQVSYQELFRNKLIDNGFIALDTKRMTSENLYKHPKYLNSSGEPTEDAWNLLTPLIVEYSDLRMI